MSEPTPLEKVIKIIRDSNQHLDNEEATKLAQEVFAIARWEAAGAFPKKDGDTTILGPGIFASADGKVINWNGQNFVPQVAAPSQPPLKDYRAGEKVEVFRDGDWLPGFIQSIDKVSNHLHVHTDKGPKTIASSHGIRKLS